MRSPAFTLWFIVVTGLVPARAFPQAPSCPPRSHEISRDPVNHVLVCEWNEISVIDAQLKTLNSRITSDRHAIEQFQGQGDSLLRSFDDWVELDKEHRDEMRLAALNALVANSLAALRVQSTISEQAAQQHAHDAWQEYLKSPLSSRAFRNYVQEHEHATRTIAEWHTMSEMVEDFEHFHEMISTMGAAQQKEYSLALLHVALLTIPDERFRTLTDDLEFTSSAILANIAAHKARAGVDQLLQVEDDRLKAIAALSNNYREHLQKRRDLLAERARAAAQPAVPQ